MVWTEAVRGGEGWVGPVIVEMCIILSRCAFCTRDVRLKVPVRVQSAHLGARGRVRPPGGGAARERGDRRGRRPCRGPRRCRLSKSVAKARIAPEHRKRIVGISRFSSRPIPPRSAFATDSDTLPPRPASGAPRAPHSVPSPAFRAIVPLRVLGPAVRCARPSTCTEPGDCVPGPVVSRRTSPYTPLPGVDYSARRRIHGL